MDILWLSDYVKQNCSWILPVMVTGRALAGLRTEQQIRQKVDLVRLILMRVAMFAIGRAHIRAQFLCTGKCTQMLS